MYRLAFTLLMIALGVLNAFGIGDEVHEPSSVNAQEGKEAYIPIRDVVSIIDESNRQKEDQNSTGHGKAK